MLRQLRQLRPLLILLSLSSALPVLADPFEFKFEQIAPGVWSGVRVVNTRFPVMGSVTFVVTSEGVVVFDGGGVALMAERTIQQIRSITDKPVTHIIISHWHGDHHFGIYRYLEEFDNVQVIAHEFTDRIFQGSKIRYIDRQPTRMSRHIPYILEMLDSGIDSTGAPLSSGLIEEIQQTLQDEPVIQKELERLKITRPTLILNGALTIQSGETRIEVRFLGEGNTAGDLIMWLPDTGVIATGDIVVHPVPYGFNVPPLKWAKTMKAINELNYKVLVPGHGAIQYDTQYVDLLIEEAEEIARQRDELLNQGLPENQAIEQLDYTAFKDRHTGGDPYLEYYYQTYFTQPFSKAVFMALTGEPMVSPD